MGSNNSSEGGRTERELEEVQRLKKQLEDEKRRLQQVALEQHWKEQRLEEEQRLKRETEKWHREQLEKHASYEALQKQLNELKIQQQCNMQQMQQQQKLQTAGSVPVNATIVKETVSAQQRVPSIPESIQTPNNTKQIPSNAPLQNPRGQLLEGATSRIVPQTKKRQKPKKAPEAHKNQAGPSNVRCNEWSILDYVKEENSITEVLATSVMDLLDGKNSIPFIARYCRGDTHGMEADEVHRIKNSYEQAKFIKQRAVSITKEIEKDGNWTPEFHSFVQETKSLSELNHIRSIFKASKTTAAQRMIDQALVHIAKMVIGGKTILPLCYSVQQQTEGLSNEQQVKDGIVSRIASILNKDKCVFDAVRKLRSRHSIKIETKLTDPNPDEPAPMLQEFERQKYVWYNNFVSTESALLPADMANIKRGEAEKVLIVQINVPIEFDNAFKDRCFQLYKIDAKTLPLHKELMSLAIDYMYQKWTKPFVIKKIREELNEKAEEASMEIIEQNIKRLFLAPSVKGKVVIGLFSVSQWICKLAVVSEQGNYLETQEIYPHNIDAPGAKRAAEEKLISMVLKYKCTAIAVGNGTACRENEDFLKHLIQNQAFGELNVSYTIVDEAGLHIFSCSREAASEFPQVDDNVVAAISIARRLQDPVAELVKIKPIHLVAEIHQQGVPEKKLTSKLNEVITELVSSVGVDINTASAALLKRVAGLDEERAKSIIEWRKNFGPFTNRNDLMKVKGINRKTFEQCSGFIKIMPETVVDKDGRRVAQDSLNFLDQTFIHPKYYDIAKRFLEAANCNVNQLGTSVFTFGVKLFADQGHATLAKKFCTTKDVIELIVKGLTMENLSTPTIQQAREEVNVNANPPPIPKGNPKGRVNFDDLTMGTVLTGVVSEVKTFGAFVRVGVGRPGLVRKNNMNGIALSAGQRVEVIVNNIDRNRRIFGLTLSKCI